VRQRCVNLECEVPFPRVVFSSAAVCSAATDALVQIDSSAAVKVMALLTQLAAGTSVFPRLAVADLCRAAGFRPKVEGTATANGSADRGKSCSGV
jgi:hypothetical protein